MGNYSLLIDTATRVSKIIQNAKGSTPVQIDQFKDDIEKDAYDAFLGVQSIKHDWLINDKSRQNVIQFCELLSNYFESVLINAEDQDLAQNRQAFMNDVNLYFNAVGDWLKLSKV